MRPEINCQLSLEEVLNAQQKALVQSTFARAARLGPHLAATFYAELFAIDPTLRAMFKGDMIALGEKLMSTLNVAVQSLDQPEALTPTLKALAVRHVGYGVEPQHYTVAGFALMRTLRHELGADMTPEAREAWAAAYRWISDTMRDAAYPSAALTR